MDKNIVALLNNNFRVIIPDFGAFIIKQKEPKIVVFNEFLKYDDGLLIEFMVKTEGMEKEMARQQLSDFAGYAARELEIGNIVAIEGLGMLQKESNGKIVFTAEHEIRKPISSKSAEEESVIQLDEEKPLPKPKPKTKRTPKTASKVTPEVPEPKAEETKQEVPEPTVVSITPEVKDTSEGKAPVETTTSLLVPSAEAVKPTGNWSKQVVKWFLILLLANIVIIAYFVFQDNIRTLFKPKNEPFLVTDSLFDQLADSVRVAATDTALIFRKASTDSTVEENTPLQGNIRFYIVAGCFRDEINADELVKSLKNNGFDAEKFGKIGNLYAVSFVSFDDKELAVKELKRIREEIYPEAWMTRF